MSMGWDRFLDFGKVISSYPTENIFLTLFLIHLKNWIKTVRTKQNDKWQTIVRMPR